MSKANALEKLLDGAEFQWKPLDKLIVSLKTGLNPRQNFQLNTSDAEGYYVTVREIQNGEIVFLDKTDKVNKKALELINNRSNLEAGDILFSGTGTVGRTAVIEETPKNWNIKEGVYVIKPLHEAINPRYLSHLLNSKNIVEDYRRKIVGSPVVSLPMSDLRKLKIPIPCPDDPKKSLAIQAEIVRILGAFTALTTELTTELTARKKQYNHYRDQLLTFSNGEVEWKPLGKVLARTKGTPITAGQMKQIHKEGAPLKIFAGGKTVAYVNFEDIPEKDINKEPSIIVKSRGVIEFEYYDKPFSHKNEMWSYHSQNEAISIKYVYHFLKLHEPYFQGLGSKMQMPQIATPDTDKFLIPIPCPDDPKKSLAIQAEIVRILGAFTALTTELTTELTARKKQYEYYRDMLLNFPKPEEQAA